MAKENKTASEKLQKSESTTLWIWRAFGIFAGMLSATQIAVNGYLGKVVGSPIKASAISFTVGIIFLAIICIVLHFKNGNQNHSKMNRLKIPGGCGSVESLADYIFLQMSIYQEL